MKSTDIINLVNINFKKKEITITHKEKNYTLTIEEHFRETSIIELIDELRQRSEYCLKNNIKFDIMQTIYLLMVKHFTDIKFSNFKSIEKQYSHELDVMKGLIDLGLFTQILQAFDPREVDRIGKLLEKYKENMKVIANTVLSQELEREGKEDGELLI